MTRIVQSLAEISAPYDALFCDLWGCLHNGVAAFPAAVAALQAFRATGGRVVLLTNAPRPAKYVIATLDRLGVPRDAWDLVVSSGDAAQDAMFAGAIGRKVWHLGPAKDNGFFEEVPEAWQGQPGVTRVPLEEAEGIVCTGPFDELNEVPEDYRPRFLLAKTRGLPLLCANPDIVVDMGETRIYCAGALAALYEEMGGEALYFGKPHPPVYDLARRRLAALGVAEDARILAIGDGVNTDVAGAAGEGIDALFVTGGLAADQFGPDVEAPDAELLDTWLAARQQAPQFAIGHLR
ncbi:TIGR01459 family HAD-type hydrolase [Sinirhodobacter huangdaonensis]|uniref:TIGR01459 family HAD-type hydrolase n=1 Tax=Paenirhodobacter huangdaonensis TaxID=2501515 RepID=A0A3S3M2R5_9RHOB|nr:TIGR01459 family HAD-type hydrolase [Sinirhodobacter huangdaonensis]RWR54852.1 TIGR01459 family HAD-type hydrolase [Sinirhodobacter huangdaonensis]